MFRIVQEALNNVMKHSGATAVTVRFRLGAEMMVLEIEDNGRGTTTDARSRAGAGFGMQSMRERAAQLGGYFSVDSVPGTGTTIRITDIPYRLVEAEDKVMI